MEMEFSSAEQTCDDIFHCGRCKVSFNSLTMFFSHKRECCNQLNRSENAVVINVPTYEMVYHNVTSTNEQISSAPQNSTRPEERILYATHEERQLGTTCLKCEKSFRNSKHLSVHLRTHEGNKPFQCPICGRCFTQNTHLQRHLQAHRVWPDGLNNTVPAEHHATSSSYSCSYCDVLLPNYSKFRVHLKMHAAEKQYKCIQSSCMKLFTELELLLDHVADDHHDQTYSCNLCDQSCSSLEEISSHQQNHSKEPNIKTDHKHKCNQCDASFRQIEKLTFHAATHSHSRMCSRCNKSFSSEKRLRSHLRIHENTKPFQCRVCSASFRLKKYLTTHMLRHGEPSFSCSQCDLKFKRKDLLSRHFKIHQKRKLLDCPFKPYGCISKFSRKDKLNLHLKSHMKKLKKNNSNEKHDTIAVSKVKVERATSPTTSNMAQ